MQLPPLVISSVICLKKFPAGKERRYAYAAAAAAAEYYCHKNG